MLIKVASMTLTLATGEVTPFKVAVIVVDPLATPVTIPEALFTLAVAASADIQTEERVMSVVVPFVNAATAFKLTVSPFVKVVEAGEIAMLTGTPSAEGELFPPSQPASSKVSKLITQNAAF
jgi:hypothetical protein